MLAAGGCESSDLPASSGAHAKRDATPALADASAQAQPIDAAVADAATEVFVHGASRCGECHDKMFDEWSGSLHAKSMTSPLFKAAEHAAGPVFSSATCERCHAPLAAAVGHDAVADEGDTCDVCHTLRDPKPTANGAGFRLAIDDMVKYGPRCDLKDHYFHRMGCSPEHREAIVCGGCHWWEPKGLPVFTEYADWKAGPESAQPCQSCHMPGERSALAEGSPVRDGVPHHGLMGIANDLRQRALSLQLDTKPDPTDPSAFTATVTLMNANGGHSIPSGLPERRIAVHVRVLDAHGAQVAAQDRELGRVLVDASGTEVPFWRAVKVGRDTRIPDGGSWTETFPFALPAAGSIEVQVVHRTASDVMAQALGVASVDTPMTSAKLPIAAPGKRTARTVTVRPAAAGKRQGKAKGKHR